MDRLRPLWFEQFEQRLLLTTGVDASVGFQIEPPRSAVSEVSEGNPSARVRLALSDRAGQPITSVQAGEDFFLDAYVADLRSEPQGVFAAYLDLAFDAGHIVPAGNVEFGSVYKNGRNNSASVPGVLDEVGAFSGSGRPIGAGDFLLFRAPFRADAAGTVSFVAEPATLVPRSVVLLYGENSPLANEQIDFGWVSLNVLGPQDSSLEDGGSLAAGFFEVSNSDPPSPLRDYDSPQVVASPTSILLTGIGADLLLGGTTLVLGNAESLNLWPSRAWVSPAEVEFLDHGIGLVDGFNFTARTHNRGAEWQDRGLFLEPTLRLPARPSFSMMDSLLDDDAVRPRGDSAANARVREPIGWSSLFHDHQWLTAGLLRIGWTTEPEHRTDADAVHDDEMDDLAEIAFETTGKTRLRASAPPEIDDDEDESVGGVDAVFSEITELDGIQGIMMVIEVDILTRNAPLEEPPRRPDSLEAAPTDSRNNDRPEQAQEREAHDNGTPAA